MKFIFPQFKTIIQSSLCIFHHKENYKNNNAYIKLGIFNSSLNIQLNKLTNSIHFFVYSLISLIDHKWNFLSITLMKQSYKMVVVLNGIQKVFKYPSKFDFISEDRSSTGFLYIGGASVLQPNSKVKVKRISYRFLNN